MIVQASTFEANLLSFVFSALFVSSIYIKDFFVDSPITSPKYKELREKRPYFDMSLHPTEIKQRSASVSISIILSTLLMFLVCKIDWKAETISYYEENRGSSFFSWIGLYPLTFSPVFKAILLNSMLFLGEIWYLMTEIYQGYRNEISNGNPKELRSFLHYLRFLFVFKMFAIFVEKPIDWLQMKHMIIAPVLEELLFRGLIFGLFRDAGIFK